MKVWILAFHFRGDKEATPIWDFESPSVAQKIRTLLQKKFANDKNYTFHVFQREGIGPQQKQPMESLNDYRLRRLITNQIKDKQ